MGFIHLTFEDLIEPFLKKTICTRVSKGKVTERFFMWFRKF
jgi:hypothetical protein